MPKHDTYNYTYREGREVSHRGITNDPERREKEHQRNRPGGKLTVDGNAKTREGALKVERGQTKTKGYNAKKQTSNRSTARKTKPHKPPRKRNDDFPQRTRNNRP